MNVNNIDLLISLGLVVLALCLVLGMVGSLAYTAGRASARRSVEPEDLVDAEAVLCGKLDLLMEAVHALGSLEVEEIKPSHGDPLGRLSGRAHLDGIRERYRAAEGARLTRRAP